MAVLPESDEATELIAFEIWAETSAASFSFGWVELPLRLNVRMFCTAVVRDAGRTPMNWLSIESAEVCRVDMAPPGLVMQAKVDELPFC